MPIIIRLDRILADRKMSLTELSEKVGITLANLSNLKTGKVSAIRLATMEAICKSLDCQPGELFEYREEETTRKQDTILSKPALS